MSDHLDGLTPDARRRVREAATRHEQRVQQHNRRTTMTDHLAAIDELAATNGHPNPTPPPTLTGWHAPIDRTVHWFGTLALTLTADTEGEPHRLADDLTGETIELGEDELVTLHALLTAHLHAKGRA